MTRSWILSCGNPRTRAWQLSQGLRRELGRDCLLRPTLFAATTLWWIFHSIHSTSMISRPDLSFSSKASSPPHFKRFLLIFPIYVCSFVPRTCSSSCTFWPLYLHIQFITRIGGLDSFCVPQIFYFPPFLAFSMLVKICMISNLIPCFCLHPIEYILSVCQMKWLKYALYMSLSNISQNASFTYRSKDNWVLPF